MLAREVSRHKAASTPSQSLSQQLFPSSSPSSPQHAGNGQYSKRPTKQPTITGSISILNPTNSSVLNFSSQPTAQPMVQNKAPHRSIQTSRLADTLDRSDSFHDVPASRPVAKVETETNPLAQLHEAVYFDENDFVDDDELNLDDDDSINNLRPQQKAAEPMSKPPLPPVHNSQAPLHPSRPAAQSKNVITIDDDEPPPPPSSIPIPWSSSPLEHLTAQANKPLSMGNPERGYAGAQPSVSNMMISDRRPKPLARKSSDSDSPWGCKEVSDSVSRPSKRRSGTLEESNSDLLSGRSMPRESSHREALETSSVDAAGRPPKKRTIPWLGTGDQNEHMDGEAEHSMNTSKHQRVPLNKSRDEDLTKTPHMRQKNSDPVYAWEKTASAVKEEQKRLRQTNRKSTLTTKADEEFAPEQDENLQMPKKRGKNVVPAPIFLSDEQQRVLDMVVNKNKSVFYTGSAGTGKSVLLREIISALRRKYIREPDRVAVTASTGLAACNIGGITLHSFGGIALGKDTPEVLCKKIRRNIKAKNRWLRTKVLIVDEISMVDGDLFDKLEAIARKIRNNGRPFGGIQLILTGDFFQLPPVPESGKLAKFSFEAGSWNTSINHTIGLTQVFRQKDPVFAGMLNEMRLGRLSKDSIDAFRKLARPIEYDDGLEATELFPTRTEVDNANNMRMQRLSGASMTFDAHDGGSLDDKERRDKLLANCMAPPRIELKKGSQVMLIKNIDETLVNGSLGKVHGFMDEKTFGTFSEDGDEYRGAMTSQKVSADETQLNKALARLEELRGSDGLGDDPQIAAALARLQAMKYRGSGVGNSAPGMPPAAASRAADTGRKWPLVRFTLADGTSRDLLCQPETWKIELPNGEVQASRTQVPLILAWALSIHKAQGQTLERVKVDLGRVFEKGQAYVALSRATCQEGLQVLRFDPRKVMAHDKVGAFYRSLYSVHDVKPGRQSKTPLSRASSVAVSGAAGGGGGGGMDEDSLFVN